MMQNEIINGIFKPKNYTHAMQNKEFKWIAVFVYRYGKHKGQWAFELYATMEGHRMLHNEYFFGTIPESHIEVTS